MHTKGPWEIDPESGELNGDGYILGIIYGAQDYPCLDDESDEYGEHLRECIANGHLVKAAPDLYQALAFAKSVILSGESWDETCEQVIDGALRKARDESNGNS